MKNNFIESTTLTTTGLKSLLIATLVVFCYTTYAQPGKVYSGKKQHKDFYVRIIEKYCSSDIKEIWKSDTDESFETYIDGNTEKELIESFNTVIHELLHGYNGGVGDGHHYFIDGATINVPYTKRYRSPELNSLVRKGQQDSIFRYGLYVGGKGVDGYPIPNDSKISDSDLKNNMSVVDGIYGMVEEFDAYYYGAVAAYEMYDYYVLTYGKEDADAMGEYKSQLYSGLMAYYEFRLFIAWYLVYAKEKHPDVYKEIINNKPLRVVFSLVDNKFKALTILSAERVVGFATDDTENAIMNLDWSGSDEDFIKFMQLSGLQASDIYEETTTMVNGKKVIKKKIILEADDLKMIKDEYNSMAAQMRPILKTNLTLFTVKVENYIEYLQKQMNAKMNTELSKFRVEGVTGVNYKEFVK